MGTARPFQLPCKRATCSTAADCPAGLHHLIFAHTLASPSRMKTLPLRCGGWVRRCISGMIVPAASAYVAAGNAEQRGRSLQVAVQSTGLTSSTLWAPPSVVPACMCCQFIILVQLYGGNYMGTTYTHTNSAARAAGPQVQCYWLAVKAVSAEGCRPTGDRWL
jgi:hypothetical protein